MTSCKGPISVPSGADPMEQRRSGLNWDRFTRGGVEFDNRCRRGRRYGEEGCGTDGRSPLGSRREESLRRLRRFAQRLYRCNTLTEAASVDDLLCLKFP
jgi:hypothetical protein